jgi:hypothetical protein
MVVERLIAGGAYPTIAAAAPWSLDPDRRFDYGLELVIEGMRTRLSRLQPANRARPRT